MATSHTHSQRGIPAYVLDDLSSRFIINSRPEEMKTVIRIFFQIEAAHWFYLDFHRIENPNLPQCSIKVFANLLMKHCSMLQPYVDDFDNHFEAWRVYKRSISTYGAIILDKSLKHVLLVQSFSVKKTWGFPKGKINYNEKAVDCAAREVLEETGFDISPYVDPEEYFERSSDEQVNRLYIIANVPLDSVFQPKTRREIRDIQWFPLETLLNPKGEQTLKDLLGHNYNLYLVMPYLRELRKWINQKLKPRQKKGKSLLGSRNQSSVRYSRDMLQDTKSNKQGRKTVGESLFANKETREKSSVKWSSKQGVFDTNSFYSKAWFNFRVDTQSLIDLLPLNNPQFSIANPSHSQHPQAMGFRPVKPS